MPVSVPLSLIGLFSSNSAANEWCAVARAAATTTSATAIATYFATDPLALLIAHPPGAGGPRRLFPQAPLGLGRVLDDFQMRQIQILFVTRHFQQFVGSP